MSTQEENEVVSAQTGFALTNILGDLVPSSASLKNRLVLDGTSPLNSDQIYGDKWDGQEDVEMAEEDDDDVSPVQFTGAFKPERSVKIIKQRVERPKSVYELFPTFDTTKILDFTELFKGSTLQRPRVSKRPFHIETVYPKKRDIQSGYLESVISDAKRQVGSQREDDIAAPRSVELELCRVLEECNNTGVPVSLSLDDRTFDLVSLSDWENQILFEPVNDHTNKSEPTDSSRETSEFTCVKSRRTPVNTDLESGAWTQSIIWSPRAPFQGFTQPEFNHQNVIPEERSVETVRPRKRLRADAGVLDKFNLSNDQSYKVSKAVRQTLSHIAVEHAYPARKLQLPFYKTVLSKQDARSFHRPALQFTFNVELRFSKVRTAKKTRDKAGRKLSKGGIVSEGLRKASDLSLQDTSDFVLWEFSEEHPPIIQNFGMASSLMNYYRKRGETDDDVPKYDLGAPFVLKPHETPFMKFGSIDPGQTIPALYNNLMRAPLFRHNPYPTDFLVIKNTVQCKTKYFLREITYLFVVGQTYPVAEVPKPRSRQSTNTLKLRLQIITLRLLWKSAHERLKISRLTKYFPDQTEVQIQQRLKEFMDYQREGPHRGFWRLKPGWGIPSDVELLEMVTPEEAVLAESMQVGQRHLLDAGYTDTVEEKGDQSNISFEEKLAPWKTTENFLLATQGMAMLQLHGEGDPTGRGEAFSFIRKSMKEPKLASTANILPSWHRLSMNLEEQNLKYKSEIERIWKAQFDSLSRKEVIDDENEDVPKVRQEPLPPAFRLGSPHYQDRDNREKSVGPDRNRRVLRIQRLIDGEWQTKIVRDPVVIQAYVRKRLKEEIARRKKNQSKRLNKKSAQIVQAGGTPMQLKPETTRRCGNCGQLGHMKSNRKCPRWADFHTPESSTSIGSSVGSTPPAGPNPNL
ncbi:TAF1 transcription initiation factor TFIID subunit TAF1 [Mycena leptocephala]|nr:TAF1 transcription initiation factor TFIID subunit TAF1 [Mycena leptocephala]